MNRQAFADIEKIRVRVEERRVGVKGPGNWRVHEFSGFDAIPARLRAAFARRDEGEAGALALDAKIRELYLRRKQEGRFEEPYEAPGADAETPVKVERTVTISLGYRQPKRIVAKAA